MHTFTYLLTYNTEQSAIRRTRQLPLVHTSEAAEIFLESDDHTAICDSNAIYYSDRLTIYRYCSEHRRATKEI